MYGDIRFQEYIYIYIYIITMICSVIYYNINIANLLDGMACVHNLFSPAWCCDFGGS